MMYTKTTNSQKKGHLMKMLKFLALHFSRICRKFGIRQEIAKISAID